MSPNTVPEVIKSLDGLSLSYTDSDEDGRKQVIAAAYRLLARYETPFEQTWKFTTAINTAAALQALIGLGLWKGWKMEADNGENDKSLEELLKVCQHPCDKQLLRRLLRLICAAGFVEEVGEDRYRPTRTSLALGDASEPIVHTAMV